MRLETTQIVHAAQVWVCDACGSHADKPCSCKSTAHQEERAAKREYERQKKIRQRAKKANGNNKHVPGDADLENTEDSPAASAEAMKAKFAELDDGDSDETCWRRGLLYRATNAAGEATFEDWSSFTVDSELVVAAERAAEAWRETAAYLRRLCDDNAKEKTTRA